MKRSGLPSASTFLILSAACFVFAVVLFLASGGRLNPAGAGNVRMALIGGCLAAVGSGVMFWFIADTMPEKVGGQVLIMVASQVVGTWAVASLILTGKMPSANHLAGLVCALGTIYFFNR